MLLIIAALLIIAGFIGILFPIFPGVPIIYAALVLLYATSSPHEPSLTALILFGVLTVISLVGDQAGRFIGAKRGKASRAGELGALVGLILGVVFAPLGLWSLFLLPPLGVVIGELLNGRKNKEALSAGIWTFIGSIASLVLNLVIASAMLVWYLRILFDV